MAKETPYWWVLHWDKGSGWLSEKGELGFTWATRLALGEVESVKALAEEQGISTSTVYKTIRVTRSDMWGSLSDEGIRSRIRRPKLASLRCKEPGCPHWVSRKSNSRRELGRRPIYCEEHATPAARTARSRREAKARARTPAP